MLASLATDALRKIYCKYVDRAGILVLFRAQFIPEISADPSVQIVNFVRTPQWFVTRVRALPSIVVLIFIGPRGITSTLGLSK